MGDVNMTMAGRDFEPVEMTMGMERDDDHTRIQAKLTDMDDAWNGGEEMMSMEMHVGYDVTSPMKLGMAMQMAVDGSDVLPPLDLWLIDERNVRDGPSDGGNGGDDDSGGEDDPAPFSCGSGPTISLAILDR